MKIHVDKIEGSQPHQLRARDVRLILEAVPAEWITELKEVRVANSLEYHKPYAFFARSAGCLTIYSRTGTKQEVLQSVLSAIAADSLNIKSQFGQRYSEADQQRLGRIVQPLVDQLLPAMAESSGRQKWKVEI